MLITSNLSPASGQLVEEGAGFDYAGDQFMLVDEFGDLVPESSHTVEIQYVNAEADQADSGNESEEKISCQEDLKIEESKCRCNDAEVENDSAFEEDLTNLTWLQNITNIMSVPSLSLTPVSPKPAPKVHKSRLNKLYQTIAKCQEDLMKNLNEYQTNANMKPPYSYCTLICMAMRYNNNKMTLSAIYTWIKDNFRYYRNADPSWQNSIRHNLSLNKVFVKVARSKQEKGKGGFWKLELARLNECHKCGSNEPVKYQRKKRKIKPPVELPKEEPPATPAEYFAPEATDKNSPFHDFNLESLSGFSFDNNVGANVVVEPALPPPLIPEEDLLGLLLVPNDWEDMQLEMLDSIMDSCFK